MQFFFVYDGRWMDDCLTADKELKEMVECRPAFSHGGGGKTFMARWKRTMSRAFSIHHPFNV